MKVGHEIVHGDDFPDPGRARGNQERRPVQQIDPEPLRLAGKDELLPQVPERVILRRERGLAEHEAIVEIEIPQLGVPVHAQVKATVDVEAPERLHELQDVVAHSRELPPHGPGVEKDDHRLAAFHDRRLFRAWPGESREGWKFRPERATLPGNGGDDARRARTRLADRNARRREGPRGLLRDLPGRRSLHARPRPGIGLPDDRVPAHPVELPFPAARDREELSPVPPAVSGADREGRPARVRLRSLDVVLRRQGRPAARRGAPRLLRSLSHAVRLGSVRGLFRSRPSGLADPRGDESVAGAVASVGPAELGSRRRVRGELVLRRVTHPSLLRAGVGGDSSSDRRRALPAHRRAHRRVARGLGLRPLQARGARDRRGGEGGGASHDRRAGPRGGTSSGSGRADGEVPRLGAG